ncbi:arsenic resistance protein [Corynebacterium sp. L4756]|uniref:arsenic resistance protein n=1 Tax=unclassified Corynebacterium TaxID=2624378 RepID=UPI00374C934E
MQVDATHLTALEIVFSYILINGIEKENRMIAWLEKNQILMYLAALVGGSIIGLSVPQSSVVFEPAINPILGLLLYSTFLAVPFNRISASFKDLRFVLVITSINFLIAPVIVWILTRFIASDQVLLIGVLFVLLVPCVDYVIVFSHLAGAAHEKLLSATPLLMLGQMVMLPVYLWLIVGSEFVQAIDFMPFIEAFLFLIVVPLILAALTQQAAQRWKWGTRLASLMSDAMVLLMMATLAVIVASQISGVAHEITRLVAVIPIYIVFAAIMAFVGAVIAKAAGLDIPARRAVVFSGVTRNSLVILPLVLALPPEFDLAPLVVVTQTLVELLIMVVMIKAVPRMIKQEAFPGDEPQGSLR